MGGMRLGLRALAGLGEASWDPTLLPCAETSQEGGHRRLGKGRAGERPLGTCAPRGPFHRCGD